MQRADKERVVAELAERLRSAETLIVADYRGLTMPQIDALRGRLLEHGARFTVVKNTLTRRAAEAAGAERLLALLEGPTAIAFIEAEGDPVAVALDERDRGRALEQREQRLYAGGLRRAAGEGVLDHAELCPVLEQPPAEGVDLGHRQAAVVGDEERLRRPELLRQLGDDAFLVLFLHCTS